MDIGAGWIRTNDLVATGVGTDGFFGQDNLHYGTLHCIGAALWTSDGRVHRDATLADYGATIAANVRGPGKDLGCVLGDSKEVGAAP